jgi:hypothetical protein
MLAGSGAEAQPPSRLWLAGLLAVEQTYVFPFRATDTDPSAVPRGLEPIDDRSLHILAEDGSVGTATLTASAAQPGICTFPATLKALSLSLKGEFFLASTEPIHTAPAREIDPGDRRLRRGLEKYLAARGIRAPDVAITRAIGADLDGDGETEGIVLAQRIAARSTASGNAGGFSILAVGELGATGFTDIDTIGYLFGAGSELPAQGRYGLLALPDYNGDGRFEIAAWDAAYESLTVAVYAWTKRRLTPRAAASCGG